jgi:hypothetical protein
MRIAGVEIQFGKNQSAGSPDQLFKGIPIAKSAAGGQ